MAAHDKKSPSAAKIFHNCSGALALAGSLPEPHRANKSNQAGRMGTATHYLLQMSLEHFKRGEPKSPDEFLHRLIGIRDGDAEWVEDSTEGYESVFEVDDYMASGAYTAYNYVVNRCAEMRLDPAKSLLLEAKTNPLPEREDTNGTADVTLIGREELELSDYKNGRIIVEVMDDPQCLSYLLGRAIDTKWKHKNYRITIIQPNAAHADGPIRSQVVTKAALRAFSTKHRLACERVDEAAECFSSTPLEQWSAEYLKAGDHCLWCRAAGPCTVRAALSAKQALLDFANDPYDITEPQDIERCTSVYRWASQLESHLTSVKAYLLTALLAGRDVPGYKLVQRNTLRRWRPDISQDIIVERLVDSGYITDRAKLFRSGQLITGPQAEKLVSRELRQGFRDEFLFRPEGELTIAPINDPRKQEKT